MKKLLLMSTCLIVCTLSVLGRVSSEARASLSQARDDEHSSEKQAPEIKEKPDPLSDLKGEDAVWQGKIVVRMVLRANGKVTDISILQGGTPKINKAVVKAAKKIKFTPAMKDGHAVSQWVTIEYTFTRSDEDKK
jgi:TonB family protein